MITVLLLVVASLVGPSDPSSGLSADAYGRELVDSMREAYSKCDAYADFGTFTTTLLTPSGKIDSSYAKKFNTVYLRGQIYYYATTNAKDDSFHQFVLSVGSYNKVATSRVEKPLSFSTLDWAYGQCPSLTLPFLEAREGFTLNEIVRPKSLTEIRYAGEETVGGIKCHIVTAELPDWADLKQVPTIRLWFAHNDYMIRRAKTVTKSSKVTHGEIIREYVIQRLNLK
jgi:hypothetical protein